MCALGPVPFTHFRQRVRRHRRTQVLEEVARLAAKLARAEIDGDPRPQLPNVVGSFSLAGVARAALIYGNDYRDRPVGTSDLIEMCSQYVEIADPAITQDSSDVDLRGLMHRVAYEQFGYQFSEMENIGRTLALFEDHAGASADAPTSEEWKLLFGVTLVEFMRIGFAMHVAALRNGGQISRKTLRLEHVAPIFAPVPVDDAISVIDRWYAATPEELRSLGAGAEVAGFEKWSLNPLVVKPIVSVDDRYIIPCPRWVIDRFTPTGLYFIGWERFGSLFTDSLGAMFEAYVGTQLSQCVHATVRGEIVYGRSNEKTVDFLVLTDRAVILVEAKAARPVYSTRLGHMASDEDIDKKLGHAIEQINTTARLIGEVHPKLAHINPDGLPILGIVVTLEPFHLVNTIIHDLIGSADIPVLIASSHDLEGFIAAVYDRADVGDRFVAAFNRPNPEPPSLQAAVSDLDRRPNPLLDDAWERFTAPRDETGDLREE